MNDPRKLMQMLCGKPSDPQSVVNSRGARPRAQTPAAQQTRQVPEPRSEKRGQKVLTSELLTRGRHTPYEVGVAASPFFFLVDEPSGGPFKSSGPGNLFAPGTRIAGSLLRAHTAGYTLDGEAYLTTTSNNANWIYVNASGQVAANLLVPSIAAARCTWSKGGTEATITYWSMGSYTRNASGQITGGTATQVEGVIGANLPWAPRIVGTAPFTGNPSTAATQLAGAGWTSWDAVDWQSGAKAGPVETIAVPISGMIKIGESGSEWYHAELAGTTGRPAIAATSNQNLVDKVSGQPLWRGLNELWSTAPISGQIDMIAPITPYIYTPSGPEIRYFTQPNGYGSFPLALGNKADAEKRLTGEISTDSGATWLPYRPVEAPFNPDGEEALKLPALLRFSIPAGYTRGMLALGDGSVWVDTVSDEALFNPYNTNSVNSNYAPTGVPYGPADVDPVGGTITFTITSGDQPGNPLGATLYLWR
ncbi:hypothetical protein [Deinococcus fonticola]|uniref:hypothetical protein n=1 Tax=Deinococcus fonticola TaxID=2528713 RepID=UPI001075576C|nr:hypothetical protein [Deinococcus fonticola]